MAGLATAELGTHPLQALRANGTACLQLWRRVYLIWFQADKANE
jgi:hypothetical protein